MKVQEEIEQYLSTLPVAKRGEMEYLMEQILQVSANSRLWFLDGKNSDGKVISNPNIGFGSCNLKYADGSSREFYRIGLSANQGGISIYIMGLEDKEYLSRTFGEKLGKAKITGYCIKFKTLKDLHHETLREVFRFGLGMEK